MWHGRVAIISRCNTGEGALILGDVALFSRRCVYLGKKLDAKNRVRIISPALFSLIAHFLPMKKNETELCLFAYFSVNNGGCRFVVAVSSGRYIPLFQINPDIIAVFER